MPAIREATLEDLDDLFGLYAAVAAEPKRIGAEPPIDRADRLRRWRQELLDSDDGCMFVAVVAGKIVGNASVSDDRGLVDLGMLVSSAHRRQGIGTALLEACIGWARGRGAHKLTLQVWPTNEPAIRLYESFGFFEEGLLRRHYRRRNGEIWDAIVMGLVLE